MTPPLTLMASRFNAAPTAISGIPGNCQLAARNTAPTGQAATINAARKPSGSPGSSIAAISRPNAAKMAQT